MVAKQLRLMNKNFQLATVLILSSIFAGGCGLVNFSGYALFGGHKHKVEAEYRGLEGQTIAVVVAGHPGLEFDYPFARTNLHMRLVQTFGKHIADSKFVNYKEIIKLQEDASQWNSMSLLEMGRALAAERIVYVDLIHYTLLTENSVNLLQGHIIADVRVYEVTGPRPEKAAYQTEIEIVYPEGVPQLRTGPAERAIELRTMAHFAVSLTEKFYDHRKETE